MGTVADSLIAEDYAFCENEFYPTAEDYAAYKREFSPVARENEDSFLSEARRKYKCLKEYYSQEDLLDYLREDIAEMQGFFSWLDFVTLNLERIMAACTHYLIYAQEEKSGKTELMNDVNNLISFNTSLAGYRDMIGRNAYYYEDMLNKADGLKQLHEAAKKQTTRGDESSGLLP